MRTFTYQSILMLTLVLTFGIVSFATANNLDGDPFADPPAEEALAEDRPDAPWITDWWFLGPVTNTGGFAASGPIDWLDQGSGDSINQVDISTLSGLVASEGSTISLPDNGGDLSWGHVTIDPADTFNMSTATGGVDSSDFDIYAIILIDSPDARTTTMAPAHDDFAQIWINGDKCYNNSVWTGGSTVVNYEFDANLSAGLNVLLYRCGEAGGDDHFNLHFAAGGEGLTTYPDANGTFFEMIGDPTSVEANGKLTTTWGDIKKPR